MNFTDADPQTLAVSEVPDLSAAVAPRVREEIKRALQPRHRRLELDLSQTTLLDSSGLGALVSLHKTLLAGGGEVRLVNPSAICLRVLEITRLHRLLPIVTR